MKTGAVAPRRDHDIFGHIILLFAALPGPHTVFISSRCGRLSVNTLMQISANPLRT